MKNTTNKFFEEILNRYEAGEKISTGTGYAYRTWKFNIMNQSSEFECRNFPAERDMEDFVNTLKASGIDTIAITDQSTALMRNLHTLESLGCTTLKLCIITRTDDFETDRKSEHKAIRIKL